MQVYKVGNAMQCNFDHIMSQQYTYPCRYKRGLPTFISPAAFSGYVIFYFNFVNILFMASTREN